MLKQCKIKAKQKKKWKFERIVKLFTAHSRNFADKQQKSKQQNKSANHIRLHPPGKIFTK